MFLLLRGCFTFVVLTFAALWVSAELGNVKVVLPALLVAWVAWWQLGKRRRARWSARMERLGICTNCNGRGRVSQQVGYRYYRGPNGGALPVYKRRPCMMCGGTGDRRGLG